MNETFLGRPPELGSTRSTRECKNIFLLRVQRLTRKYKAEAYDQGLGIDPDVQFLQKQYYPNGFHKLAKNTQRQKSLLVEAVFSHLPLYSRRRSMSNFIAGSKGTLTADDFDESEDTPETRDYTPTKRADIVDSPDLFDELEAVLQAEENKQEADEAMSDYKPSLTAITPVWKSSPDPRVDNELLFSYIDELKTQQKAGWWTSEEMLITSSLAKSDKMHLKGSIPAEKLTKVSDFAAYLLEVYGPTQDQIKTSLYEVKQRTGEHFNTYLNRVVNHFYRARPNADNVTPTITALDTENKYEADKEEIMSLTLRGILNKNLKSLLLQRRPELELGTLTATVKALEATIIPEQEVNLAELTHQSKIRELEQKLDKAMEWKEAFFVRKDTRKGQGRSRETKKWQSKGGPTKWPDKTKTGERKAPERPSKEKAIREGLCFECGFRNHSIKDCRFRKRRLKGEKAHRTYMVEEEE